MISSNRSNKMTAEYSLDLAMRRLLVTLTKQFHKGGGNQSHFWSELKRKMGDEEVAWFFEEA